MAKKMKIGALLSNKREYVDKVTNQSVTKTLISIGLGSSKNAKPEYNYSVELIVRNSQGKVTHTQTNGYINLIDPRTEPMELLKAGIINEAEFAKQSERVKNIPEMVRYNLEVKI